MIAVDKLNEPSKKITAKAKRFQQDIRKNMATAIAAGFAFVIALVWRDAIQAGIDDFLNKLGIEGTGYIYKVIVALLVTIICVIGLKFIASWSEQEKNPEVKQKKNN